MTGHLLLTRQDVQRSSHCTFITIDLLCVGERGGPVQCNTWAGSSSSEERRTDRYHSSAVQTWGWVLQINTLHWHPSHVQINAWEHLSGAAAEQNREIKRKLTHPESRVCADIQQLHFSPCTGVRQDPVTSLVGVVTGTRSTLLTTPITEDECGQSWNRL